LTFQPKNENKLVESFSILARKRIIQQNLRIYNEVEVNYKGKEDTNARSSNEFNFRKSRAQIPSAIVNDEESKKFIDLRQTNNSNLSLTYNNLEKNESKKLEEKTDPILTVINDTKKEEITKNPIEEPIINKDTIRNSPYFEVKEEPEKLEKSRQLKLTITTSQKHTKGNKENPIDSMFSKISKNKKKKGFFDSIISEVKLEPKKEEKKVEKSEVKVEPKKEGKNVEKSEIKIEPKKEEKRIEKQNSEAKIEKKS